MAAGALGVGVGPVGDVVGEYEGLLVGDAEGAVVAVPTVIESLALCFFASTNAIEHVPVPSGVTLTVNFGPLPDIGDALAIPVQVLCATNFPPYAFSETTTFSRKPFPMPSNESSRGFTATRTASGRSSTSGSGGPDESNPAGEALPPQAAKSAPAATTIKKSVGRIRSTH